MSREFLVTGANGHLGINVCETLVKAGYVVRALILHDDSPTRLEKLGCQVYEGDVTDISSLDAFFQVSNPQETILIHCAGIVSIANKYSELIDKVNYQGTKNIVTMFEKYQLDRLVYVSSVHAISELTNEQLITEPDFFDENKVVGAYAKSKAKTSQFIKEKAKVGLNVVLVHPSGIIGPGDNGSGHLTMMIEDYLNGQLTSRVKGAYDFVDVRDVATGIVSAALRGRAGEGYILSGHKVNLGTFFSILQKLAGKKTIIHILPTWFARLSAPLAELYYKLRGRPPIYSKYSLYTINSNANFSHDKATKELGYATTPFEETLKATINWLLDSGRIRHKRNKRYLERHRT